MEESIAKVRSQSGDKRLKPVLKGKQERLRQGICAATAAFLLSAGRLMQAPIPLGACLVCAFPPGICSILSALGSFAGALIFTEGLPCAEAAMMSLLMLALVVVFQGTELPGKVWFYPGISAALWGILHGIGLGAVSKLPALLLQMGLCALASISFRRAMLRDRSAMLIGLGAILCGLSGLPLPVDLGLLVGCGLCVAMGTARSALILGLAIDLSGTAVPCACLSFVLPVILLQRLRKRTMPGYAAGFLLLGSMIHLLFASNAAAACFSLGAGTALGILLHRLPLFSSGTRRESANEKNTKLRNAATVLRLLRQQLPQEAECPCEREAESVYDGAAERVCRCCERFRRCWKDHLDDTCNALNSASREIICSGVACAEDFPLEFREQCCHLEGFVTAVNQELEGMLFRRQYRMRLRESSQVVAEELRCLEDFLLSTDRTGEQRVSACDTYLPEVGICSMGKDGDAVNGDRSRRFYWGNRYYILLCDGMGSGEGAARMSTETITLLEELLKSGMLPENALKLLNGAELLRGEERFTTVDLLAVDLKSGEAELLKWGAAPSYYRQGERVEKIGTAVPPPGVGVGGEHIPERYTLSLSGGELLVLRSDGACSEEIEEALRSYTGTSSVALAAYLISGISGEDDMTAVTVSLRRYLSS